MTPYFTQHSPPALVATLPPIEHISNDDGSGGYQRPWAAAAGLDVGVDRARLGHDDPQPRVDVRPPSSAPATARSPPAIPREPPDNEVPAPRGTTGDPVPRRPAHDLARPRPSSAAAPPRAASRTRVVRPVPSVLLERRGFGGRRVRRQLGRSFLARRCWCVDRAMSAAAGPGEMRETCVARRPYPRARGRQHRGQRRATRAPRRPACCSTTSAFRVGEGAKAALVGANGAGKTTLLRIMAGDDAPDAGSVHVAGGDGQAGGHAPVHRLGPRRDRRSSSS